MIVQKLWIEMKERNFWVSEHKIHSLPKLGSFKINLLELNKQNNAVLHDVLVEAEELASLLDEAQTSLEVEREKHSETRMKLDEELEKSTVQERELNNQIGCIQDELKDYKGRESVLQNILRKEESSQKQWKKKHDALQDQLKQIQTNTAAKIATVQKVLKVEGDKHRNTLKKLDEANEKTTMLERMQNSIKDELKEVKEREVCLKNELQEQKSCLRIAQTETERITQENLQLQEKNNSLQIKLKSLKQGERRKSVGFKNH